MPNDIPNSSPTDQLNQATGSNFIINGSSYSGADIKVVVHVYDLDKAVREQKDELREELDKAEDLLAQINSAISKASSNLNIYKPSTYEANLVRTQYSSLISRRDSTQSSVLSLQNKLSQLDKGTPVATTKVLAEVQTLSLSIYRDKQDVRACGSVYPKGFTRGPRVIAGTLVFTVFDEHVLYRFLEAHVADFDAGGGLFSALLDQIPPVDITVAFANEYGAVSRLAVLGVEFVDEGQTMSIEDIITENTVSFVARDVDPMRKVARRSIDENSRLVQDFTGKRASDLLYEEDYQTVKNSLSPFARFKRRRNPFI